MNPSGCLRAIQMSAVKKGWRLESNGSISVMMNGGARWKVTWCLWHVKSGKYLKWVLALKRTVWLYWEANTWKCKEFSPRPSKCSHSFVRTCTACVSREGAPKRQSNCASDQSLKCDYLSWRHPSAGKVSHLRGNEVKVREVLGLRPLLLTVIANHQMILTYNSKNKYS